MKTSIIIIAMALFPNIVFAKSIASMSREVTKSSKIEVNGTQALYSATVTAEVIGFKNGRDSGDGWVAQPIPQGDLSCSSAVSSLKIPTLLMDTSFSDSANCQIEPSLDRMAFTVHVTRSFNLLNFYEAPVGIEYVAVQLNQQSLTGGFTGGSSIQTLPGLKRGNDLITGYGKFEKDAQSGLVTGGEVVLNADKNISSIVFTQPFLGTPAPILNLWRTGTDQFKCNHRGEEGITTCTATVEYQDNGIQVIHFSLVWADQSFGIARLKGRSV